jgi:nitroreductase
LPSIQKNDSRFDADISPSDGYPRFGRAARQKLTEEESSQLLSLTALSLSAFNVNNCRFVVVRDPELRKEINKFSEKPSQVPHAASLIILCTGLTPRETYPGSKGNPDSDNASAPSRKKDLRRDSERKHRDEALCACGIAAQTLMLTARAMNYDAWRLEGFDAEGVGKLINLPQDYVVAMLLVVGKNIKQLSQNPAQFNLQDVVVLDQF